MGIAASRLLDKNLKIRQSYLVYSTMANGPTIFQGSRDNYNGIIIKSREEPCERPVMEAMLKG